MLRDKATLTSLRLGYNNIADAGSIEIAKCLRSNTALTCLDLSHNQIGDKGGMEIAIQMRLGKSALSMLDLTHNLIGNDATKEFTETAGKNPELSMINLTENFKVGVMQHSMLNFEICLCRMRRVVRLLGCGVLCWI